MKLLLFLLMAKQLLFTLNFDANFDGQQDVVEVTYDLLTDEIFAFPNPPDFFPVEDYTGDLLGAFSNFEACGLGNTPATTLTRFRVITNFPYAEKVLVENSDKCNIICNLVIQTPVQVQAESAPNANNATITVTANSSNTPIEYSLDNLNFQTSNIFTGLTAGNYTVYARDAGTCTYQTNVVIPPASATYGIRYRLEYRNFCNQQTSIFILKKNYTGAIEDVCGSGDPLKIKLNKEGDRKYQPIKGSGATIGLRAEERFQFLDLFSNTDTDHRIDIYQDGQLNWRGYIRPRIYNQPYTFPYFVEVIASDGLALLKEIDYLNADGSMVEGFQSQLSVILFCLNQLNFELPLYENLNIYETRHQNGDNDSPLIQTFVDTSIYEGMKCYQVLEVILAPYGARLNQYQAAWHILQVNIATSPYLRRRFDTQGNFELSETFDPVVNICNNGTNPFLGRSQNLEIEAGLKNQAFGI